MRFWRSLLRLLGLSMEARVKVSAPGIDVVLTGERELVRSTLAIVKEHLERQADAAVGALPAGNGRHRADANRPGALGQDTMRISAPRLRNYIEPSELDDEDSPYVVADAVLVPPGKAGSKKPVLRPLAGGLGRDDESTPEALPQAPENTQPQLETTDRSPLPEAARTGIPPATSVVSSAPGLAVVVSGVPVEDGEATGK